MILSQMEQGLVVALFITGTYCIIFGVLPWWRLNREKIMQKYKDNKTISFIVEVLEDAFTD